MQKQDKEAITSYQIELNSFSLMEMHSVNDPEVYLDKIYRPASIDITPEHRGLWGDIFCIHWASIWIKIPIRIWSKSQGKCYLHFNSNLSEDTYDILFHDENALVGHFELMLRKRKIYGSSNLEEKKLMKFICLKM